MALGVTSDTQGFAAGWDWKGEYVDRLASGDGLERFSQGSLTPDTTILFAGPARFSDSDVTNRLHPLGLVDSFSYQTQNSLQPLWEIGSNRTFFTRGKSQNSIQVGAMLADHASLMNALTQESYNAETGQVNDTGTADLYVNTAGTKSPGVGNLWFNLDSEALSVPFGILMTFKTKGQTGSDSLNGNIMGAVYLENCHLSNFQFQVSAQAPVISENVGIMFDRAVPVAVG